MRRKFQIIQLYISLLSIFIIHVQAGSPEEEIITIKFKTFGLSLSTREVALYNAGISGSSVSAFSQQFSYSYTYTGPRKIIFYTSPNFESSQEPPQEVAAMVATIPVGIKEAVIFVATSQQGSKIPYRAFITDDSMTHDYKRSVHFYNLTSFSLAVHTFGKSVWLNPGKQHLWDLENQARASSLKSSLKIAVNTPENRIIYSNRFQVRPNKRLTFIAHNNGNVTAEGFPRVSILHFTKSTIKPAPLQ